MSNSTDGNVDLFKDDIWNQKDLFGDLYAYSTTDIGNIDLDNTITIGDSVDFTLSGKDSFEFYTDSLYETSPSIRLGKHEITEETAEKLQALLDVIDSLDNDNDLKALFNTQLSFNRIKNTNETKSD